MNRVGLSSLKAFVSRTTDYYRRPWGRGSEEHPRRVALVGSTNYEDCLPNDPSGNRRFIVVPVRKKGPRNAAQTKDYLDANREQIWAEALFIDKDTKGKGIYLEEDLEEEQFAENEKYRNQPNEIFENALEELIKGFPGGELELISIQDELFKTLRIANPDNRSRAAVTAALRNRKVEKLPRSRKKGKRKTLWRIPEE